MPTSLPPAPPPVPTVDAIFVQIASFRDRELGPTIADALATAEHPERLTFGICHQYDDATADALDPWVDDPRFRIDRVPWTEAYGVGWARNRTQALYREERYTLQIDSHMRFAEAWDERYVTMLNGIDSDLPLLSNYPAAFRIEADGSEHRVRADRPHRLTLHPDRAPYSLRQIGLPAEPTDRPGRHALVGAGNIFTLGRFCHDVPYDPEWYFAGEEIGLALRAYTHGYDIHYPNEHLLWHRYSHGEPTHWNGYRGHGVRTRQARESLTRLMRGDDDGFGPFGLGRRRTAAAYQRYLGIPLPPPGFAERT